MCFVLLYFCIFVIVVDYKFNNMKISKKLLLLVLMLFSITSSVFADGYRSLKFTMGNGETYIVESKDLEFVIRDQNITFNNTDLILPVGSLVSMEFTDHYTGPAGVNEITLNDSGKIKVFTIDGKNIGEFNSYNDVVGSLPEGVYVINDSKGTSLKIRVEK